MEEGRRDFLKITLLGSLVLFVKGCDQGTSRAVASPSENNVVVFGSDGLRHDTALWMWETGSPGLSRLYSPIPALSGGGKSVTQPGWADIWSGLPTAYHNAKDNSAYKSMPEDVHIMAKLMNDGFFSVWITGKGTNIKGHIPASPHHQVYRYIVNENYPGEYHGDKRRSNQQVFDIAQQALQKAITEDRFVAFVHFTDPDNTGHQTKDYNSYVEAAEEVDQYISALIDILPPETNIIYCSDHGFSFNELGDVRDYHHFAPIGMVATNVSEPQESVVTRTSIGRAIYSLSGNDPNNCSAPEMLPNCPDCGYSMYGIDFLS
jgi:hypothetical protein